MTAKNIKGVNFMPRCPKCKAKYKKGADVCENCSFSLSSYQQHEEAETHYVDDVPAFLTSVEDGIEAEMLQARLESAEIPCYMKPHDNGGLLRVYMGPSNIGSDFFVPSKLLEKAKMAIDLRQDGSYQEGSDTEEPQPDELPLTDGEDDGRSSTEASMAPQSIDPMPGLSEKPAEKSLKGSIVTAVVIVLLLAAYFSFDALLDFFRKLLGY